MIKLVTFDLDNTLWHTDPVIVAAEEALRAWLQQHHPQVAACYALPRLRDIRRQLVSAEPALDHQISRLRTELLHALFIEQDYAADKAREAAEAAFQVFYAARQQVTVFEQAPRLLADLRARYQLGALTNGNADLDLIGLNHLFDFAFHAEHHGGPKPEPMLFQAALAYAGVDPEHMVHIGDSLEDDIAGAARLGIHSIWVNLDDAELKDAHRPDATVTRLADIPAAIQRLEDNFS